VSVPEQTESKYRSGAIASAILAMHDAGIDRSFYYHIQDQVCRYEDFHRFFSDSGLANMMRHWNEIPHRFGLYSMRDEVRPQYHLFQMLSLIGSRSLAVDTGDPAVRVVAGTGRDATRAEGNTGDRNGELGDSASERRNAVSALLVNYGGEPADRVAIVTFTGLAAGERQLSIYRSDVRTGREAPERDDCCTERRKVSTLDRFECHVYLPEGTVALVRLEGGPG